MIYDISQELFSCRVFPGDAQPIAKTAESISEGGVCNLTTLSMCAHNGTHVDAPYHFFDDGKTIDQIDLHKFVGPCYVTHHEGDVTAKDAMEILEKARNLNCADRILIGGPATVTAAAATVFAKANIDLIGNESQTVGPINAPKEVHLILLKKEVVLLEGINLSHVPQGRYFLNAAPLNLGGKDGAPCRAILLDEIS